jgi:nucleotide-binding universal stress UspA family protein
VPHLLPSSFFDFYLIALIPCQPPANIPQQLSLILEYIPGKITDTLDRLIALYRPDSVVVGTRGRRPWVRGIGGIGSVSK